MKREPVRNVQLSGYTTRRVNKVRSIATVGTGISGGMNGSFGQDR